MNYPQKFQLELSFISLFLILLFAIPNPAQSQDVYISEFMAINNSILADEDNEFPDWIEIHNRGSESQSLLNWSLTDKPDNLTKWQFPDISLAPGAYLIVFASEKKRTDVNGNLHTNFKLSGSGEYLALVADDGSTIIQDFGDKYPVQQQDVSYGLIGDEFKFMSTPTPGQSNQDDGIITPPTFSHNRGFFESSFSLEISSSNSETIYYTLDGSVPLPGKSSVYSSPIELDQTSVVSAIAWNAESEEQSHVVTQTYIFKDILDQPNNPAGYPSVWGQEFPGDYEMDSEICTTENKENVWNALKSLPAVSLVLDVDHLFLDSEDINEAGIYLNSTQGADEWERPVSIEYFDLEEQLDFQYNAGLRIHGGNSRKPGNSPKHGFRVSFRSQYGPSKLNFNMFDEKSADNEFNSLVLRAGYNYSWTKNNPTQCEETDYIRDPFTKKTQMDMDRLAAHRKFVHVYLNGMYWGVYDMTEKITNDFAESYLGGREEDYDVVKDHNAVTDGDRVAWDSLLVAIDNGVETNEKYFKIQGKNEDGSDNPELPNLLDVRNLADYMLINFYIGNGDWDRNNWLALRNKVTNEHGFKFLCWDAETSMNELEKDITDIHNDGNPSGIFQALLKNDEFKLYFADRIHKHFFNNGDLTTAETIVRYSEIADELESALLAESARWGDYRRDVDGGSNYDLYTVEHWKTQVDYTLNTYLPQRSDIVLQQLRAAGYYSGLEAPEFDTHGGDFTEPISVTLSASDGDIYFTTDDSDPRTIGGGLSESATLYSEVLNLNEDVTIRARAYIPGQWSPLTKASFDFPKPEADTTHHSMTICEGETAYGHNSQGVYYLEELGSKGQDSVIVLTLNVEDCTVLGAKSPNQQLSIYPNPASDYVRIEIPQYEMKSVEILNISGQPVLKMYNINNLEAWHLNISVLESGVYFLRIKHSEGVITQRMVKE